MQCNATLKAVSQKLMIKRYTLQRTSVLCEIIKNHLLASSSGQAQGSTCKGEVTQYST